MVLPILGANTESASYDIANSARINHNNAAYLSRTISSTGSERIMTVSVWVKRSEIDHEHTIFSNKTSSSGINAMKLAFFSNNRLDWTVATTGDSNKNITTNALFRDVAAWYHIVATVDTTQSTNTNRMKLYVNGTQITSFSSTSLSSTSSPSPCSSRDSSTTPSWLSTGEKKISCIFSLKSPIGNLVCNVF